MPFSRMDPSCTIGFYAKSKKDFESLCSAVSTVSLFLNVLIQVHSETESKPLPHHFIISIYLIEGE